MPAKKYFSVNAVYTDVFRYLRDAALLPPKFDWTGSDWVKFHTLKTAELLWSLPGLALAPTYERQAHALNIWKSYADVGILIGVDLTLIMLDDNKTIADLCNAIYKNQKVSEQQKHLKKELSVLKIK